MTRIGRYFFDAPETVWAYRLDVLIVWAMAILIGLNGTSELLLCGTAGAALALYTWTRETPPSDAPDAPAPRPALSADDAMRLGTWTALWTLLGVVIGWQVR